MLKFFSDLVNTSFQNTTNNYMTLEQRLKASANNSEDRNRLEDARNSFMRKNKINSWQDIQLCTVSYTTLDKILIDTTLQRNLLVRWVSKILSNFLSYRVMPINVYVDPNNPEVYTCWDGQHTAVMLYIIAVDILKLDPSECTVPIIINPASQRPVMRGNFLSINTDEGKTEVGNSEIWRQHVLGVRIDGTQDRAWLAQEQRQQVLEQNKLFVCEKNTHQACQPGAITNMSELLDTTNYNLEVITNIAKFLHQAEVTSKRPVTSSEMWQLGVYFRNCVKQKIVVDDQYISDMVACLDRVFGGYNPHKILAKAKNSYDVAYINREDNYHKNLWGTGWNESSRKEYHSQFLSAILSRHSELQTPVTPIDWDYDTDDLSAETLRNPRGLTDGNLKEWNSK